MKRIIKCVLSSAILASMMTCSLAVSAVNTHTTDPNGDGIISIADAIYITGFIKGNYGVTNISRMDFNGDLIVDSYDAVAIQRYLSNQDY